MDSFYYNLLNIGKKKISEQEYIDLLDRIIEEEKDEFEKQYPNLDKLCKAVSHNINSRLKELNFDTKIINTKNIYDMYEHQFVLSSYVDLDDNINYVLIDPTYSQFRHKDEYDFKVNYPADILSKTLEGKQLLDSLMCLGYSKIDDNDLKRYIGSLMYEDDINKIDITINDLVLERRKR
jgi:hypothetical protein